MVAQSTFGVRFGRRVRLQRTYLGYSQADLADKAGLSSKSVISRLENEHIKDPKHETVRALSEVLGINTNELRKLRGDPAFELDLSDAAWLDYRAGRRDFLHPRSIDFSAPAPLVRTAAFNAVSTAFESTVKAHLLIEGGIASGKSSLVELAIQEWRKRHSLGQVTILPLAGEYATNAEWRTAVAHREFLSRAEAIQKQTNLHHLVVVEDAHECFYENRRQYRFGSIPGFSLENVDFIVTTRPSYAKEVKADIEEWAAVKLTSIKTDPVETASGLIRQSIVDVSLQDAYERLFSSLGESLIGLAASINSWQMDRGRTVAMELAYRAVQSELDRVASPRGGHSAAVEPDELRAALLAIWVLGGVETDFNRVDLGRLTQAKDPQHLVDLMLSINEIVLVEDGLFRCARHPAWGQLAMRSIDEFPGIGLERDSLRRRVLEGVRLSGLDATPSDERLTQCLTAFLFSLLFQKVATPEWLGFISTGRHMHDEFAQAGLAYVDGGRTRDGELPDKLDILLQITSSIRRSNPRDHTQRQDLLERCGFIIDEIVEILRKEHGFAEESAFPGHVLYEIGYLHNLRGDLGTARRYFNLSKRKDMGTPDRQLFGLMSGVCEAIMLTFLGQIADAGILLKEQDRAFQTLHDKPSIEPTRFMRFWGNQILARYELAMTQRRAISAEKLIDEYVGAALAGNLAHDRGIFDARVLLLRKEYDAALETAVAAASRGGATDTAENYTSAHRVLGDCHLGLKNLDAAIRQYDLVVSPLPELQRFMDPNMQLAKMRRDQLTAGVDAEAVLASSRL